MLKRTAYSRCRTVLCRRTRMRWRSGRQRVALLPDGAPGYVCRQVRHFGEGVAVLVAETMSQATDAVERVEVRYEALPAVTRSADAMAPEAPLVWEEHGANLCVDSEAGDQEATDAAFARAAHIVRLAAAIKRVTRVPMEVRAAGGVYQP